MKLIDRTIAWQFLINTLALTVILFGFIVMIDVSINLDRFVSTARESASTGADGEAAASGVRTAMVTVLVVVDLWWPRLLHLWSFLSGMILVGAFGFTATQMVRNREVIALLAAGQSLHTLLRPFLIVAIGFTAVQALNQELVIPRIAPLLGRDHGDSYRRGLGTTEIGLVHDGVGLLINAQEFDADSGRLSGVWMLERDESGRPVRAIEADVAIWRDGGWDLENGSATTRHPAEGPTRAAPVPVERIETALDPLRLRMESFDVVRQALGVGQIAELLTHDELLNPETRDELLRLQWSRFGVHAANILAVVIAAPFFLVRTPVDFAGRVVRCAPIVTGALVGGAIGATADLPGVHPILGAFLPAFVLAPASLAAVGWIRS